MREYRINRKGELWIPKERFLLEDPKEKRFYLGSPGEEAVEIDWKEAVWLLTLGDHIASARRICGEKGKRDLYYALIYWKAKERLKKDPKDVEVEVVLVNLLFEIEDDFYGMSVEDMIKRLKKHVKKEWRTRDIFLRDLKYIENPHLKRRSHQKTNGRR